jgi:hypothetical protein
MKPAEILKGVSRPSRGLSSSGTRALRPKLWFCSCLVVVSLGIAAFWLSKSRQVPISPGDTVETPRPVPLVVRESRSGVVVEPGTPAAVPPFWAGDTTRTNPLPKIEFRGNKMIPTQELRKLLARPITGDGTDAVRTVWEAYAAHGHTKAKVRAVRGAGEPPAWTVEIEEGPRYTWGNVEVTSETLPPKTMRDLFPCQTGDAVNLVEFKSFLDSFKNYVENQGYIDFSFTPEMLYDDVQGRLNIRITLSEGRQYQVTSVSFESARVQDALGPLLGRPFSPASLDVMLAKVGLTEKDIQVVIDRVAGNVTLTSKASNP